MRARLRSMAAARPGPRPRRRESAAAGRDPYPAASQPPDRAGDDRGGADTFEWRMRESDGPTDVGHYACACGYQFAAPVETTVSCPHCGAGQAW